MATSARSAAKRAQPDITLVLDLDGVIRDATVSASVPDQDPAEWIGRAWSETVGHSGGAKVERMLADARIAGVTGFREVSQRFPSGLEMSFEYTAVRQDGERLVAIGKSLQTVVDLQSRLMDAQMAVEREHWRLREIETRSRLLFDASSEAVIVVDADSLRITEANPAAMRALGLLGRSEDEVVGRSVLSEVREGERFGLEAMLLRVREEGRAPGVLVRLGSDHQPWFLRASPLTTQDGLVFVLQLANTGPTGRQDVEVTLERLVFRSPDGFVVVDDRGSIVGANPAFLRMIQVGEESVVIGQRLGRWLGRSGAEAPLLLADVARHGEVRRFSTVVQSELGIRTEVELSAAGDADDDAQPRLVGVLIRDVGSRLRASAGAHSYGDALGVLNERLGETPLSELVAETVGVVERHCIGAALELAGGDHNAAAELLGLSRQSLHAKLIRYRLAADHPSRPE